MSTISTIEMGGSADTDWTRACSLRTSVSANSLARATQPA
jgi:hypothetical protein